MSHLYVHTPFCLSKCAYCALRSSAIAQSAIPADFPDLIAREFVVAAETFKPFNFSTFQPFHTIYFGGGTPAMLGVDGLERLARALAAVGVVPVPNCEWTVEFNPSPSLFSQELLERLLAVGVNRASIGVQSLDDSVLARVGRIHNAAEAEKAVAIAKAAGFGSVGIDLISGLPGDDDAKWRATLDRAIALGVQHISVYALTVEEGTPLAAAVAANGVRLLGDDAMLARLAAAEEALAKAGFHRYEISNYALPGHECRHNLACWRGEDYLGLGPGASSRTGLMRRTNSQEWRKWREAILASRLPPADEEDTLTPADDAEGRFAFGLRMEEGVSPAGFAKRFPSAAQHVARWEKALAALAAVGIVREISAGRWALTGRGREVADSAIERLLQ